MARGARRSSTSPSAPAVTQHAEANQAAARSPTAGGDAPAAGPDAPEEVATLRAQIEALQLRLAAAPAGGGQQGGGGAAAATAQSTTPARSRELTLRERLKRMRTANMLGISERQAARRTTPADTRCHESAQRAGSTEHTD